MTSIFPVYKPDSKEPANRPGGSAAAEPQRVKQDSGHGHEKAETYDVDDWLAAERQIDAALTSPGLRGAQSHLQR